MHGAPLAPPDVAAIARACFPRRTLRRSSALEGGFSGRTYRIDVGEPDESFVVRIRARERACAIEAAVARRVLGVVPSAELIVADADGRTTGTPFLVFRHVPGISMESALHGGDLDDGGSSSSAMDLGRAAGEALAALGEIRFSRGGLFGGEDLVPVAWTSSARDELMRFAAAELATPAAGAALGEAGAARFGELIAASSPLLDSVSEQCALVHSDFNPKNLVVDRDGGRWRVAAVIDWEFAFSGPPLADVGNMLRFEDELPRPFAGAFVDGFRSAGGELPSDWRAVAAALDLFALCDLACRSGTNEPIEKARRKVRAMIARGTVL